MAITQNSRSYGGGKYALEFDRTVAGWIKDADGGHASAEVVTEKMGVDHLTRKHLGPLKYEEVTFKCGTGMTRAIYQWIQTAFNQTSNSMGRQNGAIIHGDYDGTEISRLTFLQAMITEYAMPALDASSKDAAMMTIKFQPEKTTKEIGKRGKISFPVDSARQKQWLPSNFQLDMGAEFSAACKRVNKIDALTVKQKVVDDAVGEVRDYQRVGVGVEIPNLVITTSEADADSFYKWHEDFVVKGNCDQGAEKGAHLYYKTPNQKQTLFTLEFKQLGIFKISPDKVEAGAEGIRRVKIEMYCEDIMFTYDGSAVYGDR